MKTLDNTDVNKAMDQVSDIKVHGNGDLFKLLSKASSKNEGWMKSTKAMYIEGVGCMIQVTTQQGDHVAEAIGFMPDVRVEKTEKGYSLVLDHISSSDEVELLVTLASRFSHIRQSDLISIVRSVMKQTKDSH